MHHYRRALLFTPINLKIKPVRPIHRYMPKMQAHISRDRRHPSNPTSTLGPGPPLGVGNTDRQDV